MLGRIAFENGKELAESRGGQDPKEGTTRLESGEDIFPLLPFLLPGRRAFYLPYMLHSQQSSALL